jgi:hypothetical protein
MTEKADKRSFQGAGAHLELRSTAEELLTTEQAADALGVGERELYERVKDGRLPPPFRHRNELVWSRARLRGIAGTYGELCDVVERAWQHWPVDSYEQDPHRHSSDYARAAANRVAAIVGLDLGDPRTTLARWAKQAGLSEEELAKRVMTCLGRPAAGIPSSALEPRKPE